MDGDATAKGPAAPRGRPDEPAVHCTSCGRPGSACGGCGRPFDPPRFCATCGTRLAVRVSPAGYVGRCKLHGQVAHS